MKYDSLKFIDATPAVKVEPFKDHFIEDIGKMYSEAIEQGLFKHPTELQEEQEKQTFTGAELYLLNSEKIPCLIDPIMPVVGVVALVGGSDTGKSMLLRQLAINVVNDDTFLEFPIHAIHRKVIFIATEDDNISTSFLIRKQAKSIKDLENIRFHFETENIPEYLDEQLALQKVDLIVIDAWSDVFGLNLNDSALIRGVLNRYRAIANRYQCLIVFLHHTGKRTQKLVPSKDNILSGQGFEAKMRLVMELRSDIEDENFKHLCIVKGNYLGKEYKNSSYKLSLDPENFTFTDTGDRVPFEELATLTDAGAVVKIPLKKAYEVDDLTHKTILEKVFDNGLKPKYKDLCTRISNKYGEATGTVFGGKRVDAYLDYFLNDMGWITKVGKDRSPTTYYYLSTDHLTDHP